MTDAIKSVCPDAKYGVIINAEYKQVLGFIAGQLEVILKTDSIRDALPPLQYSYIRTADLSIQEVLKHQHRMTNNQIIDTVYSVCVPLGKALQDLCNRLGIDIVTGKPLLGAGTQD